MNTYKVQQNVLRGKNIKGAFFQIRQKAFQRHELCMNSHLSLRIKQKYFWELNYSELAQENRRPVHTQATNFMEFKSHKSQTLLLLF